MKVLGGWKGFSLLEVLIGAFVLSVVLLGVGSVWLQHQRAYLKTRDRMICDFLLQSEMERVVAGGYSSLPGIAAEPAEVVTVRRRTPAGISLAEYRTDVSMTENSEGSLRKALVTVSYDEPGGETVEISAETDLFWSQ
jgi:prepilin-type N-terminal cleavage/methylation domain-containing protein